MKTRNMMDRVEIGGEALSLGVAADGPAPTVATAPTPVEPADAAATPAQAARGIDAAPPAASATRTEVAMTTALGTFVIELFDDTPLSRTTFLNNVVNGVYTGRNTAVQGDAFIHRRDTDFVIQGGGYYVNAAGSIYAASDPSITGETGVHANSPYTIAWALSGGNQATAGGQWFINLRDNASTLTAYAVFGQVVGASTALDADVALPVLAFQSPFNQLPALHGATTQNFTTNDLLRVTYDVLGVATADSGSTGAATVLSGTSLFANDVDLDTPTLAVAAVNGAAYTAGSQVALPSGALLTINANGTYSYNPNHAFDSLSGVPGAVNGSAVDSFTYTLAGGHLVTGTATVAITVTGSASSSASALGSAGNDTLGGTDAGNLYLVQQGGDDSVTAAGGDDGIYFGAAYTAGDSVDGGTGTLDQIGLQGDYSGGFSLGTVSGVELIVLLSGSDTRFGASGEGHYSYALTMADANVAAGQSLAIQANSLVANETLTFDGHLEANGSFLVYAGAGNDHIIGGALADSLYGGAGADQITGGGGADQLFGGSGADTFLYLSATDSTVAARDHILDFASGDHLDLSAVDGNTVAGGTQNFTLVSGAFTGAGQLHLVSLGGNDWAVEGDTDGNGSADFSILVTTGDGHQLGAADFVGVTSAGGAEVVEAASHHMVDITPTPDFVG